MVPGGGIQQFRQPSDFMSFFSVLYDRYQHSIPTFGPLDELSFRALKPYHFSRLLVPSTPRRAF